MYIPDRKQHGTVESTSTHNPRSYIVETPTGTYKRNSLHLNRMPTDHAEHVPIGKQPEIPIPTVEIPQPVESPPPPVEVKSPIATVTRSGRVSNRPARFKDCVC